VYSLLVLCLEVSGTKNSAVYSMRGTLQYRFTTARVQWPCSTDIHWAYLITQSGPARYVLDERHSMSLDAAIRRGPVMGSAAEPTYSPDPPHCGLFKSYCAFSLLVIVDRKVSKKLCRPPILGGSR